MQLQQEVSLAPFTTFGIGGPARWFVEADSEDTVLDAVRFARESGLPIFVMGGGSNILVSDRGFAGLVIHLANRGMEQDKDLLHAAAGENWDALVTLAVERGLGGIECLAGIPGTVGGTPVQNVGAYGQEVASSIQSVRVIDLRTLAFLEMPASACGFSYRRSIFNSSERGRYIVTRVSYRLRQGALPMLSYADIKQYFKDHSQLPTLPETACAIREIRRRKGMLLVGGDPDCRSAGSFFKNPVVPESLYARIASTVATPVPQYPADHGFVKIPAAWLVEQAGFGKGFSAGTAGVSSKHTLALINRGGAQAADILLLANQIVRAVQERFGIHLEPEPVLVGMDLPLPKPR